MTTFFNDTISNTSTRITTTKHSAHILLDKNEQSEDVAYQYKLKVLNKLIDCEWNRYPNLDYEEIESNIANYCQLAPENIALASGSANIIACLLSYFGSCKKNIIIAQPTYSLFDYHCKTYNIPYTPWILNADLQFDYNNMPAMDQHSVLIITSPNNPTGNSIQADKLESMLKKYQSSLIILDSVYAEFADEDVTPLVKKYDNLIVLRSFSKAFPIAGIRLGYLCANAYITTNVKKLMLPFSINPLALSVASEVIFNSKFMQKAEETVKEIIYQREVLFYKLRKQFDNDLLTIYPSQGNFLLIRINDKTIFDSSMNDLTEQGIKVLNTSNFLLLENTFRVSIGTEYENEQFFQCLTTSIESNFCMHNLFEEIAAYSVINK